MVKAREFQTRTTEGLKVYVLSLEEFKDFMYVCMYVFLERGKGREKERASNLNM